MKVFIIPPVDHMDISEQGDGLFVLAQLYNKYPKYKEYVLAAKAAGRFLILDNGVGDDDPITNQELWSLFLEIQPDEVIPLDTLYNKEATLSNFKEFVQLGKEAGITKPFIFACPQGDNLEEWLECYNVMCAEPLVSVIGMSKKTIPHIMHPGSEPDTNISISRNLLFSTLKETNNLKRPLHFLGAGEVVEFEAYEGEEMCRSTDSCFTVWSGMNGEDFTSRDFKRIPTPRNYFELAVYKKNLPLIYTNIEVLKKYTSGVI